MKLILPLALIIISGAMYFVYIDPTWKEIGALRASIADYNNILDKSKELVEQRDAIQIEYDAIPESDTAKLNKIIPQTFDTVRFANDMNNIASRYGVSLDGFKVDQVDPGVRGDAAFVIDAAVQGPYKISMISLTLKGSYEQFIKFLQDVEANLQLTVVTALNIKSSDRGNNPGSLQYTLDMKAYSLK